MTLREFLLLTAPVTLTAPIMLSGGSLGPDLRPRRPVTVAVSGHSDTVAA